MKQQFGQPFFTGALNGAMAGGVSGQVLSGSYQPYVSVMQIVPSGANFAFALTDNRAGTASTLPAQNVTYAIDQFGRVDTSGFTVNGVFDPVFYLVSGNEAFVVSMLSGGPISGHLDPQTLSSFTAASINGTLVEGTSAPPTSASQNFSGFLTFNGSVTPATIVGVQGCKHIVGEYGRGSCGGDVCAFQHGRAGRERDSYFNVAGRFHWSILYCVADGAGDDHDY